MIKVCPAVAFFAPLPMPEWTGETYEDVVVYVKQLRQHIQLLNQDREEISAYCNSNP